MATAPTPYRLRCTYTYANASTAQTIANGMNTVLSQWTDPITPARATISGSTVELKVVSLTEAQAKALLAALWTHVYSQTRTAGKFSLVRTPDVT